MLHEVYGHVLLLAHLIGTACDVQCLKKKVFNVCACNLLFYICVRTNFIDFKFLWCNDLNAE